MIPFNRENYKKKYIIYFRVHKVLRIHTPNSDLPECLK